MVKRRTRAWSHQLCARSHAGRFFYMAASREASSCEVWKRRGRPLRRPLRVYCFGVISIPLWGSLPCIMPPPIMPAMFRQHGHIMPVCCGFCFGCTFWPNGSLRSEPGDRASCHPGLGRPSPEACLPHLRQRTTWDTIGSMTGPADPPDGRGTASTVGDLCDDRETHL